jgi:hypothetical protein
MRNNKNANQKVRFERKRKPCNTYEGVILFEDHESCTVGVNFEGTEATITLYYDEWRIIKEL